jgi:hypothetical protein
MENFNSVAKTSPLSTAEKKFWGAVVEAQGIGPRFSESFGRVLRHRTNGYSAWGQIITRRVRLGPRCGTVRYRRVLWTIRFKVRGRYRTFLWDIETFVGQSPDFENIVKVLREKDSPTKRRVRRPAFSVAGYVEREVRYLTRGCLDRLAWRSGKRLERAERAHAESWIGVTTLCGVLYARLEFAAISRARRAIKRKHPKWQPVSPFSAQLAGRTWRQWIGL